MKNILILVGSPRKKGNTSIMADYVIEHPALENYEIKNMILYDYNIKPCVDCRSCKKGDMVCVLKDGMEEIYEKIEDAELIIIGSPIYWFGPTAKTKLFLDRLRPYYANKKMTGKKGALLLPAGSGESDCDLTIEMFKRSFEALGVDFLGAVTAEAYDAGDVNNNADVTPELNRLVNKII
ncbi:flavodoxin family protein [Bacteroidota bacterium]